MCGVGFDRSAGLAEIQANNANRTDGATATHFEITPTRAKGLQQRPALMQARPAARASVRRPRRQSYRPILGACADAGARILPCCKYLAMTYRLREPSTSRSSHY